MIESTHEETLLLSYANRASSYDECTSKDSFIAAIKEHPNLNESFEEQLHKNADWEKRAKKEEAAR